MAIRTTDIRQDDKGAFTVTLKVDNQPVMITKVATLDEANNVSNNFIKEGASDTKVLLNENI